MSGVVKKRGGVPGRQFGQGKVTEHVGESVKSIPLLKPQRVPKPKTRKVSMK